MSEADRAHRFGRWVGVPLLVFIGASVFACVVFAAFLFITMLQLFAMWAG